MIIEALKPLKNKYFLNAQVEMRLKYLASTVHFTKWHIIIYHQLCSIFFFYSCMCSRSVFICKWNDFAFGGCWWHFPWSPICSLLGRLRVSRQQTTFPNANTHTYNHPPPHLGNETSISEAQNIHSLLTPIIRRQTFTTNINHSLPPTYSYY